MRVFILDDLRGPAAAYSAVGLSKESVNNHSIHLIRTFDSAVVEIKEQAAFDLWILDHDLGCFKDGVEQSGYDFLNYCINNMPEKIPDVLYSCSANPLGRARILALHKNWTDFKTRVSDAIRD